MRLSVVVVEGGGRGREGLAEKMVVALFLSLLKLHAAARNRIRYSEGVAPSRSGAREVERLAACVYIYVYICICTSSVNRRGITNGREESRNRKRFTPTHTLTSYLIILSRVEDAEEEI